MRSHKITIALGLLALTVFAIGMVGCGGSDNNPTSTAGSLTDPAFMAVQDQLDNIVDSTLTNIVNGFQNLTNVSGDGNVNPVFYGPVQPDSDVVSATYAGGWHVVLVSRVRATYDTMLRDSVQFYANNGVSQMPTAVDSLYYRHQWRFNFGDTTVTHLGMSSSANLTIGGLQGNVATIDGSHEADINTKQVTADSTVWRSFSISADVTDLQVSKTFVGWAQGCPSSGTISGTIDMSYQKDDGTPMATSWTFTATFSDGTMSATVARGTTTWHYTTDVCTTVN
jgi:hypothetical protein